MRYNLVHPNGHVERGLSAYALRVGASSLQWKNKVRPDHIDDIDMVLAIQLLQHHGYDVQTA